MEISEKECTKCLKTKPLEDFVRHRGNKDGKSWWCKRCHADTSATWRAQNPVKAKELRAKWRAKNPDAHRRGALRKSYGLEIEDFDRLLRSQGGKCKICGRTESDAIKEHLCVDHIAGTTLIRGLLCSPCNAAIGFLQHDPELLIKAARYLEEEPVFEGTKYPVGVHRKKRSEEDF